MSTIEHHDTAIIGSGFSGLGMAVALREEGLADFVVLEQAESLGGTWRDNTYPGIGCDVPTPLYSFSFAPNPDWSHFYAKGGEIWEYLEGVTDDYGVRPHIRFDSKVVGGEWLEEEQRWLLSLEGGEQITARFVVSGTGGLTRAGYPDIEGLSSFDGPVFHTAEWNHDFDPEGKRMAVIGTGASAIQVVPRLAEDASRLDVFQRTPPWVIPKMDFSFGKAAKAVFRRFPITLKLLRLLVFTVSELAAYPLAFNQRFLPILERVGRKHLERQVPDPELRRRLTPGYRAGCKRLLPANDWYPALQRDNVELVTESIERVTPRGILTADGVEHELDAIVCGTGFDLERAFAGLNLRGRGGATLEDLWSDGIRAHRGAMLPGFPNLMLLSGPNTGTGTTSQIYMIESQIGYVMRAREQMREQGAAVVEVRHDAYDAYNEWIARRLSETVWMTGGCSSWYLGEAGNNPVIFPGFGSAFRRSVQSFRTDEHEFEPVRPRTGTPEPRPPAPVA